MITLTPDQAGSMHFAPHVWATRHIRRYRQSDDEDEEELEEGAALQFSLRNCGHLKGWTLKFLANL